jgi:hypothetical protein
MQCSQFVLTTDSYTLGSNLIPNVAASMAVADSLNSGPATNACAACALLAAAAVTRRLRKRRLRACAIAVRFTPPYTRRF